MKNYTKVQVELETVWFAPLVPPSHPYRTITALHGLIGFAGVASNIEMHDT